MVRVEGSLPYQPVRDIHELEDQKLDGLGCVIVIVNLKGQIFAVQELDKEGNPINLISETRKKGEFIWQNVIGGLVEEMGVRDKDMQDFWWLSGASYLGRTQFPKPNLTIHADVVCVLYTGTETNFHSRNEVKPLGFFGLDDFQAIDGIRISTLPSIDMVRKSHICDQIALGVNQFTKRQIFNGQSTDDIFIARQQNSDLVVKR